MVHGKTFDIKTQKHNADSLFIKPRLYIMHHTQSRTRLPD